MHVRRHLVACREFEPEHEWFHFVRIAIENRNLRPLREHWRAAGRDRSNRQNKAMVYDLLFRTAAETLLTSISGAGDGRWSHHMASRSAGVDGAGGTSPAAFSPSAVAVTRPSLSATYWASRNSLRPALHSAQKIGVNLADFRSAA